MDANLFYSVAALHGYRNDVDIAKILDITSMSVNNKTTGKSPWKSEEIAKLVWAWDLDAQTTFDIWFKGGNKSDS